MKEPWKIVLKTIAVIFGLFLILLIGLTLLGGLARGTVESIASAASGRTVKIEGDMRLQLLSFTPHMVVHNLKISQPDWLEQQQEKTNMADIGRTAISVKLLPLFVGRVIVPSLEMEDVSLDLVKQESGRANWTLNNSEREDREPFRLPTIQEMHIKNGHVKLVDEKRKLTFVGNFESSNTLEEEQQNFQLNGDGQLNDKKFLLKMTGDSLFTVQADHPYAFDADINFGATRVLAKGSVNKPFDLGKYELDMTVTGNDMADLYFLTGLAFPNTPPYKLNGYFTRDDKMYRYNNFSGIVGDSDLRGELSVDTSGERPKLTADLVSKSLDFDDLGTLFGAAPDTSPGETASPEQKDLARRNEANNTFLPDAPLQVERVRNMDAAVRFRADSVQAHDVPLRHVAFDFTLENAIMKFDPFTFTFPRGRLSGTARIDAQKDVPNVDMDVRLTNARLEDFFTSGSTPALEGTLLGRAKLHGAGNSVHKAASNANGSVTFVIPHGEIRHAFAELLGINVVEGLGLLLTNDQSQIGLRCGIANFKADHGMLYAQNIALDTDVVLSTGSGEINLDTEAINLELEGNPKEARLIRVMAPITLSGTLRHPHIGIDAAKAAGQIGIAAVLGALLTPIASILPFVDDGLAKDADCSALIAQARQHGAPAPSTRVNSGNNR